MNPRNLPVQVTWSLSGLEFMALWYSRGRDRLPYPMSYRYPPVDSADEAFQLRKAAVEAVIPKIDAGLFLAVEALEQPLVRVESHGFTGPGMAVEHRLYAGIRKDTAAVALQDPNTSAVSLTLCSPGDVPRRMIAAMPDAPAGRLDDIKFARTDIAAEADEPIHRSIHTQHRTMQERVARMFTRPQTAWGEITAYPGPARDNRPTDDGDGFFWIDFAGDGRYYVRDDALIQARPLSPEKAARTIEVAIQRTSKRAATADR